MKKNKAFFALCVISFFIFSGCDLFFSDLLNEDGNKTSKSDNFFIPYNAETEKIHFNSNLNGKKCFLILTNQSEEHITQKNDTYMTISKGVCDMGNGYFRDEVHFSVSEISRNIDRAAVKNLDGQKKYRSLSDLNFYYASGLNSNDTAIYSNDNFELKVTGNHCRIWYLNNSENLKIKIPENKFSDLKNTVDTIFEKEIEIFGSNNSSGRNYIDADSSTKLDILIYDLFGDATQNQTSGTFGFFNPNDLYFYNLNSNKCEAIHIDSYFLYMDTLGTNNQNSENKETHLIDSTIVHEFQHLLHFCNKGESETWYNEMLSMCAEDIFQNTLNLSDNDSPKSRFNNSLYKPWLGFKNWSESTSEEVLYCYANAYAFGAYLMRNYNGINLIHEIATNNYTNEDSINEALKTVGYKDEDFYTVLNKFGNIYIYDKNNTISLNKTITDGSYILKAINLYNLNNLYTFNVYKNNSELENDIRNNLYIPSDFNISEIGATDINRNKYYLRIPRIFKNLKGFKEELKPYGFVVYYLGTINSSKEYEVIKVAEPITRTFVYLN